MEVLPFTGMALGQMVSLYLFAIFAFVYCFDTHGDEWPQRTYMILILIGGLTLLFFPYQLEPIDALLLNALLAGPGLHILQLMFRLTGLPSRWHHICGDKCRLR